MILGFLTLFAARIAAVVEVDAKKVVALSTLRQLGLMVISLGLGNALLCLFHLLIHAVAKANLFIVVGNLLSTEYSQQDSRSLSRGIRLNKRVLLSIFLRILRLSGMIFFSGYYSKEIILMGLYNLTNRMIILLLLLILSTMTLVYCIKLLIVTMTINKNRIIRLRKESNYVIPILLISSLVIIRGFLIINYLLTLLLKRATIEGLL